MPPLPGRGGKQDRGGLQKEDHGGRKVVRGETEGTDKMCGVWVISSGRVHVESSGDLTCESGGAATPVDPPDGRRGQDIQDVLPDKGGTVAMF